MKEIPKEIIDRIIDAADIVKVIGDDITLRKQGVNYTGLCPFHNEKTPSFTVSPAKQIYKCFSCGKGGNVISYVMERSGLSFPEAVRELGRRFNIEVPQVELTPEQKQFNDDQDSCRIVLTEAFNRYRDNYDSNPDAQAYMAKRQISKDISDRYGIGFAYDFDGLSRSMLHDQYQQKYLVDSGLAYYDNDKKKIRDTFWQRILFPFFDKRGQVIGFTGRDITEKQAAKYKNTGDTLLFNKGKNIFGLFQARTEIQKQDKVYIVEGQFDVLSFAQNGIFNVVGGSGTAFTDSQRKLLHNLTSNVIFIYDGDAAGIHAAEKNLPLFVKDQFQVRCISLPSGKDPDDVAKAKKQGLEEWIAKSEKPYVQFLAQHLYESSDDDYQRLEKTKQIMSIIQMEDSAVVRDKFISLLVKPSGYNRKQLDDIICEIKIPDKPAKFEPGFIGLDFISSSIDKDDPVINLTDDFESFQKHIGENEPWIFYHDMPSAGDIQKISMMANRVIVHSPEMFCDSRNENTGCRMMKEMYKFGMTVDVSHNGLKGFIYYYVQYYADLIAEENPTPEARNEYMMRCAEMISYAKPSIQTVNMPNWAGVLGVKPNILKEIIKPFSNERKSKQKIDRERDDVFNELQFDTTDHIPDYVEDNEEYSKMFRRYNFFPLLNKEGVPVCYMFKGDGGSFRRVADFYMEPLFHVYSKNKEENKRVIRINSLQYNHPNYMEWPSSVFSKLTLLQDQLINEGAYNFEGGTAADYQKIWACMSYKFPLVTKITVFGTQTEGCFLFANGIYHQMNEKWQFDYCDELGLMHNDDTIFYSPAYSKVNLSVRKDDDQYEQDRWLTYTDVPQNKRTTFKHWSSLMNEVYKINNNGMWGIIYAIMCAFRSEIHPINRLFTALFFIGPTMSGKTQIAVSVRSLFINPNVACSNLNSLSDAAFFSILERLRDVPQVFEEYNDQQITDYKFQGLKSATYDGDGRQKRKSATTNDIDTSKVNAPIIILGQEAPAKDDNALTNRVVLLEVPKVESFDEHAQSIFQELKEYEKAGLSYLLLEILKIRPIVHSQYPAILKECNKEVQYIFTSAGNRNGDQTRVINTVSMFLAMVKLLTKYVPELELPFTYQEFFDIAIEKIRKQVELLTKSDKLATFFNTMDFLIDKESLIYGRDFKIEYPDKVTLKGGVVVPVESGTAVIYLNLTNIHRAYYATLGSQQNPLSMTTLDVNLNSHPAFIGRVSNTRFKWMESKEVPYGTPDVDPATGERGVNMQMRKVMQPREKQTSAVVLNYDILTREMNIDFQRNVRPDADEQKKEPVQSDLPF